MIKKLTAPFVALFVSLSVPTSMPALAQSSTAPYWGGDGVSQHHQLQFQLMNDMTKQMARMTDQMSRDALSLEDRKKMSEQMRRMAKIIQFMSGLAARPAHTNAQLQKQMEQMRAQRSEMMKNSQMAPDAR